MSTSEGSKRPRIMSQMAFLGPVGTYGEQAATRFASRLGDQSLDVELVPCSSIKAVYEHPAEYLVLPIENTLHGVVLDTVDCLLSNLATSPASSSVNRPYVVSDTLLKIDHQLVSLKGTTKFEDIQWVRSHEQALGQSREFLDTHLPHARRIGWPSTAGAVQSLIGMPASEGRYGAAICSLSAYEKDSERLELLWSGTQAVKHNFTRFLLLRRLPLPPVISPRDPSLATPPPILQQYPGAYSSIYIVNSTRPVPRMLSNPADELVACHARPAPATSKICRSSPAVPFPRWTFVEVDRAEVPEREGDEGQDGRDDVVKNDEMTDGPVYMWLGTFVREDITKAESSHSSPASTANANGH